MADDSSGKRRRPPSVAIPIPEIEAFPGPESSSARVSAVGTPGQQEDVQQQASGSSSPGDVVLAITSGQVIDLRGGVGCRHCPIKQISVSCVLE